MLAGACKYCLPVGVGLTIKVRRLDSKKRCSLAQHTIVSTSESQAAKAAASAKHMLSRKCSKAQHGAKKQKIGPAAVMAPITALTTATAMPVQAIADEGRRADKAAKAVREHSPAKSFGPDQAGGVTSMSHQQRTEERASQKSKSGTQPRAVLQGKGRAQGRVEPRAADIGATEEDPLGAKSTHKRKAGGHTQHAPEVAAQQDAVKQRLLDAWQQYQQHLPKRAVFCELDVATSMAAKQAVGRPIRVYWPSEDAWFYGEVASYNPASMQHKINYADGDQEELWLASGVERVRMPLSPAEKREAPSPAELHQLSQVLLREGRKMRQLDSNDPDKVAKAIDLEACSLRLRHAAEELAAQAVSSSAGRPEAPLPGLVIWARSRGWPYWPSLVGTKEDMAAKGVKGLGRNGIYVQAFGEFTWSYVKTADVLAFDEGVRQGLFTKCGRASFKRAISEVMAYLQDGELPEDMLPDNNDQGFSSDEENDVGESAASRCDMDQAVDMKISNKLTVNSFGRIEFLHPAYHNERHLWPLGYKATYTLSTAPDAGDKQPSRYVCEILPAPDGSGPLFRISAGQGMAESKVSPQRAFESLHSDSIRLGSVTGNEGLRIFGLKSARVLKRIQQLPNAARCDRYSCWPEGKAPLSIRMTESERRVRIKGEVAMQQLPEGTVAMPHAALEGARCEACGVDEESEDDLLLQCDGLCRAYIHQDCCGVLDRPASSWVCELCKIGCATTPACVLCPTKGGALLKTRCGRWCHAACALWVPEAFIDADNQPYPVVDISNITKARRQLSCAICKQSYGACIQCGGSSTCFTAFHPLCARSAGLVMDCEHDEHFQIAASAEKAADQPQINLVATSSACQPVRIAKRRKGSSRHEGTALGDGTRLVCYCLRHQPQQRLLQAPRQQTPQQFCDASLPAGVEAHGGESVEEAGGSSRCVPYNHALRRGLRAPEVVAAAIAKRSFLRAEPYQVSELPSRRRHSPLPESNCIHPESLDDRFDPCTTGAASALDQPFGTASKLGKAAGKGKCRTVMSVSERYWQMQATESERVALGKSAIHGWGALSKVAHAKGDMVIEYSGELVRPSMADVRERQLYDRLVGAGTYIFRMNDEMCIDATRAGNLAHMLNHSCEPNCFSRTIQVINHSGGPEEHVVIFAKESVPAGTELTYNYRFSSSEVLPCNCGAASCSGLVNASGAADQDFVTIPKTQLKHLFRPSMQE